MTEPNLFDELKDKAREIAAFHAVTNGITYTGDEWEAIDIGMSVGIHAALEHFAPGNLDTDTGRGQ